MSYDAGVIRIASSEVPLLGMDFSERLARGELITGVVVTHSPASLVLSGPPSFLGQIAMQQMSGLPGVAYSVTFTVSTTLAEAVVATGILIVR